MRLSATPETCPRAAALSALYIAMGESPRWWETTALIHGLGSFVSGPSTFLPTQRAPGRASCPKETGRSQLAALGSASRGAAGAAEGAVWSEQAGASPSLPPCASSRMETEVHPFGTRSSLVRGAPRGCAGSLPVASNAPFSHRGLSDCSLFLQAFGFCSVSCPAAPGVETERLRVTAQSQAGGGGDKSRAGESRVSLGPSSPQAAAFLLLLGVRALLSSPAALAAACACCLGSRAPEQRRERAPWPGPKLGPRPHASGVLRTGAACNGGGRWRDGCAGRVQPRAESSHLSPDRSGSPSRTSPHT